MECSTTSLSYSTGGCVFHCSCKCFNLIAHPPDLAESPWLQPVLLWFQVPTLSASLICGSEYLLAYWKCPISLARLDLHWVSAHRCPCYAKVFMQTVQLHLGALWGALRRIKGHHLLILARNVLSYSYSKRYFGSYPITCHALHFIWPRTWQHTWRLASQSKTTFSTTPAWVLIWGDLNVGRERWMDSATHRIQTPCSTSWSRSCGNSWKGEG